MGVHRQCLLDYLANLNTVTVSVCRQPASHKGPHNVISGFSRLCNPRDEFILPKQIIHDILTYNGCSPHQKNAKSTGWWTATGWWSTPAFPPPAAAPSQALHHQQYLQVCDIDVVVVTQHCLILPVCLRRLKVSPSLVASTPDANYLMSAVSTCLVCLC